MTLRLPKQKLNYPFDNLHKLLLSQIELYPHKNAIHAPGLKPLSFQKLSQQIDLIVNALKQIAVKPADCVAFALPNGPELAITFLSVSSYAVSVPINPGYQENECNNLFAELDIRALITTQDNQTPALKLAKKLNIPIIEIIPQQNVPAGMFTLSKMQLNTSTIDKPYLRKDDIALILGTSGTTSRPKLVPLTQMNLCASAHHIAIALRLEQADIGLNLMPLFHIHGLIGGLLAPLSVGSSVICPPNFMAPRFIEWLSTFQPTWYTAVPSIHQSILARVAQNEKALHKHSLRFIRSSSAALPPKVMDALTSTFQVPVIEAYGMTEAAHQITSNPLPPKKQKPYSVGIATGPNIGIIDPRGEFLNAGESGEVVIKGVNVTQGYLANEEENKSTFIKGWFHTGDIGYIDTDGYLFLTDRIKELINRAGENISPREIDDALLKHPAIAQAVTFAVKDETLGEDIAAAIVLKDGQETTVEAIQIYVSEHLANYKIPRQILILTELPKSPTGKLQRIGLAKKLGIDQFSDS